MPDMMRYSQLTSRNVTLPPCLVFFGSSFSFCQLQPANQPVNEPAVALGNLLFVRVFLLLQPANDIMDRARKRCYNRKWIASRRKLLKD
ncbi:hypothetical protein J4Q44_G00105560 [Coregonus suidteri]|uniref:Uncharacterized protein n=1 Tax=Coregonus suidteri TaxID=861788 RepID=A0AAN8M7K2_9TELE